MIFGSRYAIVSAESSGIVMTPAMLGGLEYALTFHEDGKVDFVLAGTQVPPLSWREGTVSTGSGDADGIIIDYFGQPMNVWYTDTGLAMDYFGAMVIHFEAQ